MQLDKKGSLFGALVCIALTFPVAGALAIIYRFPVPFAGYVSGVSRVHYAMVAVLCYGAIGGFPLLAFLGGLAGGIMAKGKETLPWNEIVLSCLLIDVVALFVLSILDKIIGPW